MTTTRIAIVADSHWDQSSRFDECVRIHQWIAADLAARQVDVMLHAGDMFERRSTAAERLAVAAWLQEVADSCAVVLVRGNHDADGDLALFGCLRTRFSVDVVEGCGVRYPGAGRRRVGPTVAVMAMAWPRTAWMKARGFSGADGRELLQNVLRGLGKTDGATNPNQIRILLAHAMVTGSKTSTGQPLVGGDLEIGLEDLALCPADLVVLGHIHNGPANEWSINQPDGRFTPVIYPGSPRRTAYGETEPKGYLIAEFEGTTLASVERVETPATPMILLESEWRDGSLYGAMVRDVTGCGGADVRHRYHVDAEHREIAAKAAAIFEAGLYKYGAATVKTEERVRATTRARAPEVAAAQTVGDMLRAHWQAKSGAPDDERANRLVEMANELERE